MLGVALCLIVAGGLGAYVLLGRRASSAPTVIDDGPTFYQAFASLNASVDTAAGGPWSLTEAFGVASPVPSDPGSWGYDAYDGAVASCQSDFNGLTFWNGTIPLFNGTYNSGTAPFWQFVFFSNASQQILVATDVLGTVQVYPPIAMSSECAENAAYTESDWREAWAISTQGFPGNTPAQAQADWNAVARSYVTWLGRPLGEMYFVGGVQFGSGMPPTTDIQFFTCGTVGGVGPSPGLAVFAYLNDTADVWGWDNYTLGCTPTMDTGAALPLEMNFTNPSLLNSPGTLTVSEELHFLEEGPSPYTGPGYDMRGIEGWMIGLNLTDGSGTPLPMAGSNCRSWVPSLSDCAANDSGWYAVLLGPDGEWDGTYGATATGPGWSDPVLPIVNNETLVVVVPSSWTVGGDTLDLSSITEALPLIGSTVLP